MVWLVASSPTDKHLVDGASWQEALDAALATVQPAHAADRVIVELRADGVVQAIDPVTGTRLLLRRASDEDPPDYLVDEGAPRHRLEEVSLRPGLEVVARAKTEQVALEAAVRWLMVAMGVEAGSVLMPNANGDLEFKVAIGPHVTDLKDFRIEPGWGIAGSVAATGRAMVVHNVSTSKVHLHAMDKEVGYAPKAVLAAPIRRGNTILGVIELLNREDRFAVGDVDVACEIGAALATRLSQLWSAEES